MDRRLFVVVGTLLIVLSACAPSATPAPVTVKETVVVEKAVQVPVTPTPGIRKGGTLLVPLTADVNFNGIVATGPNDSYVQSVMFNGLTRFDKNTWEPSPDLAESWEISSDGLVWTFHLRKDVLWQDGQPFTADDVKFTYDKGVFDPTVNSKIRGQYPDLKQVNVVDNYTVQFVLSQPFASLAVQLGNHHFILPKHLLDGKDLNTYDDFNKRNPVGTGPYKIKEGVPGDHYTLVANDKYFRGRPNIDTVIFKVIPDANVRIAQLRTGELDLNVVVPANLPALADDHNIRFDYLDKLQFNALYLNNARPPFDDKRVRQAMNYGLDRQAIDNAVSGGAWQLAASPIHPGIAWAYDSNLKPFPYDPDKAKALLAEAGWKDNGDGVLQKDGKPFSFNITVDNDPVRNQTAVIAQQYYKKLGMDAKLELMDWNSLVSQRYMKADYDAMVVFESYPPDPDLSAAFLSTSSGNRWNYKNPEVDQLLAAGRKTSDKAERQKIYTRFQEILGFEDPAMVLLFYPTEIRAYNAALKGLPSKLDVLTSWRYIDEWWLDR